MCPSGIVFELTTRVCTMPGEVAETLCGGRVRRLCLVSFAFAFALAFATFLAFGLAFLLCA